MSWTKSTIEDCNNYAKSKGGECLSKEFINVSTPLSWKCAKGHTWDATFHIKDGNNGKGSWCSECAGNKKLHLDKCKNHAVNRGGECLSTEYFNSKTPLDWKCGVCGHEWSARFDHITDKTKNNGQGTWCPECAKKTKGNRNSPYSIKFCKDLAEKKGGECLSNEYKDVHGILEWKCDKGHTWETSLHSVKGNSENKGSWCSDCAGNKALTLKDCKDLAEERGGECLSKVYKNNNTNLKWKCAKGHTWEADFDHVKNRNHWCPDKDCSHRAKLTLEECHKFAEKKGGECLEKVYFNNRTKMKWKCSKNHEWLSDFDHIKNNNNWCPACANSRTENLVREYFEYLFKDKFPSIRPNFLKYDKTGQNLEIDCYNEFFKLGVEYHGRQHYEYVPDFFHKKGKYEFIEQQERDKYKENKCKELGIYLMIIPYKYNYQNEKKLKKYIRDEIRKFLSK